MERKGRNRNENNKIGRRKGKIANQKINENVK
jgi:hypothetical protein